MAEINVYDKSAKIILRRSPQTLCRLLDLGVMPGSIRFDDISVNVPELRADGLIVIGSKDGSPERGRYLEFAMQPPDRKTLDGWLAKLAYFNYGRPYPVALSVIYLMKGKSTKFPSVHIIDPGTTENRFRFHTIRLWEHAERIRYGDLQIFAPLLILFDRRAAVATLREEKRIIQNLDEDQEFKDELFALALMVGRKFFTEDILYSVFPEGLAMIKEMSFVQELIEESVAEAKVEAKAEGKAEGERNLVMRVLSKKFGSIPPAARDRINVADAAWCERILDQALDARTLAEIALP